MKVEHIRQRLDASREKAKDQIFSAKIGSKQNIFRLDIRFNEFYVFKANFLP